MDVYIRNYANASDFLQEIDSRISELERRVREIESELQNLKSAADKYRKLQELIKRFRGEFTSSSPIEITGLSLYIDPNPLVKYDILDESRKHMLDLLSVLKKVREVAQAVIKEGGLENLPISVQYKNGVPVKLVLS